jgi:hypothetical protein
LRERGVSPESWVQLDYLLNVPEGAHRFVLERLRTGPRLRSGPELVRALRWLEEVRTLAVRTPLLKRCLRVSPIDTGGLRKYLTSDIHDPVIRAHWEAFNTILAYQHLAQLKNAGEAVYNWIQAFVFQTYRRHLLVLYTGNTHHA